MSTKSELLEDLQIQLTDLELELMDLADGFKSDFSVPLCLIEDMMKLADEIMEVADSD